ncbi:MAG: hypothetical protein NXY57DRAFT_1084329 [Lentinula lateritia]|nr:MAG: hypothetical protein NXY57DRAFT_1084329 [Lentinula lateritia]
MTLPSLATAPNSHLPGLSTAPSGFPFLATAPNSHLPGLSTAPSGFQSFATAPNSHLPGLSTAPSGFPLLVTAPNSHLPGLSTAPSGFQSFATAPNSHLPGLSTAPSGFPLLVTAPNSLPPGLLTGPSGLPQIMTTPNSLPDVARPSSGLSSISTAPSSVLPSSAFLGASGATDGGGNTAQLLSLFPSLGQPVTGDYPMYQGYQQSYQSNPYSGPPASIELDSPEVQYTRTNAENFEEFCKLCGEDPKNILFKGDHEIPLQPRYQNYCSLRFVLRPLGFTSETTRFKLKHLGIHYDKSNQYELLTDILSHYNWKE